MIRKRLQSFLFAQNFTAQTLVIAILMALSVLFFYNPFSGIELTEWDRSFCEASLAGIDPSKRVFSFYRLYFLFPCLSGLFACVVAAILRGRRVPYFILSAAVSFLMVVASYTLRYGAAFSYAVAAAIAAACFLWQCALVFWASRKKNDAENEEEWFVRVWKNYWAKARSNSRLMKVAFAYSSFGVSLLCSLPSLSMWRESLLWAILNVLIIFVAGTSFALFVVQGGLKDCADWKLNKLGVVGIFVLISSIVFAYSRWVIPVLAGYSAFFGEHVESFGVQLFSSSVSILMSFSFLYVLVAARFELCNIYRDFVASLFLPVSLSLLLPMPVALSAVISYAIMLFLLKRCRKLSNGHGVVVWFPLVFCLLCELFFTLFEKELVGFAPLYGVYGVSFLFLAVMLLKTRLLKSADFAVSTNWFYVGALLSLSILSYGNIAYVHFLQNVQTDFKDFYEYGNLLGIVETLNKGKIPVIDYFSAHALSDVFTGIIHGLIHGNVTGAMIDPYRDFVIYSCGGVALFFLLSRFFSPFFSFALICFYPLNTSAFHFVDICLVGVLLHFWLHQKVGVAKLCLFWFLVALLAFYRYDTGVAFGIAAIVASVALFVSHRDKIALVKFVLSGISISVLLLIFYFAYCKLNGIIAVERLKEWIALTLHSNSYWAEEILANSLTSPMFIVAYFLIPFAEAFVLCYLLVEAFLNRKLEKTAALALVFTVAGLFLSTRTFVFYTLSFTLGRGSVMFCYSVFALTFFLLHLLRQRGMNRGPAAAFWIVAVSFGIWFCNLANHFLPDATNLLSSRAVANLKDARESLLWNTGDSEKRMERFRLDDTLSYYSNEFKSVISKILNEHETFLDFADVPVVYALAEREKPFYTAQSPGLLSDLYSQEMFLQEIESREVPIAITAWSDKGHMQVIAKVPHQVRFYKIAEYLYTHYRPLVRVSDFVIWCKPERYVEYVQKLKGNSWKLAEYGYEPNSEYHHYDLKWNPYVWANFDRFNAAGNAVLDYAQGTDGLLHFKGSQAYPVSLGNYVVFEIESSEDSGEVYVEFSDLNRMDSQYGYKLNLRRGLHKYLVRASQDYNWFAYNINTARLECGACTIRNVQILQGD